MPVGTMKTEYTEQSTEYTEQSNYSRIILVYLLIGGI